MTRFSHLPHPAELKAFKLANKQGVNVADGLAHWQLPTRIIPELLLVLRCLGFRGLLCEEEGCQVALRVELAGIGVGKRESTIEWKEIGVIYQA
jgi:hypothetical protein